MERGEWRCGAPTVVAGRKPYSMSFEGGREGWSQ